MLIIQPKKINSLKKRKGKSVQIHIHSSMDEIDIYIIWGQICHYALQHMTSKNPRQKQRSLYNVVSVSSQSQARRLRKTLTHSKT